MEDALVGALVGGGLACLAAWITVRHEGRLARQQILQSRFADAYITLQLYISGWADRANWDLETFRLAGQEEPTLPDVSNTEEARVSLFASDEVVDAMKSFATAILQYRLAIGGVQKEEERIGAPRGPGSDHERSIERRTRTAGELVAQAECVHQQLRSELRGESSRAQRTLANRLGIGAHWF
jgi:hypothetical protein